MLNPNVCLMTLECVDLNVLQEGAAVWVSMTAALLLACWASVKKTLLSVRLKTKIAGVPSMTLSECFYWWWHEGWKPGPLICREVLLSLSYNPSHGLCGSAALQLMVFLVQPPSVGYRFSS